MLGWPTVTVDTNLFWERAVAGESTSIRVTYTVTSNSYSERPKKRRIWGSRRRSSGPSQCEKRRIDAAAIALSEGKFGEYREGRGGTLNDCKFVQLLAYVHATQRIPSAGFDPMRCLWLSLGLIDIDARYGVVCIAVSDLNLHNLSLHVRIFQRSCKQPSPPPHILLSSLLD